jgi:hypothetical protein
MIGSAAAGARAPWADLGELAVIARQRGIEHPIRITALKTIQRGANGKINRAELTALIRASAA